MRKKLQRAETETENLKRKLTEREGELEELQKKKEEDDEDNGASLIPHIKVSLIQFLRNVALTDRQNEDLLTVIFNMMEFTDSEISDLKIARLNIKMVKGKPQRAASSSIAGGNSTNSMSKDADDGNLTNKKRGGLFGMFKGKSKDQANTSGNAGNASGSGLPPNLKPQRRR